MTNAEYNEMTKEFFTEYEKDLRNFYKNYRYEIFSVWKSMGFTFEIWENDKEFKLAFIAKIKIMFEQNPELFEV
jgi:hypothetical protein